MLLDALPIVKGAHVVLTDNSWPHTELTVGREYVVAGEYDRHTVWLEDLKGSDEGSVLPVSKEYLSLMVAEDQDLERTVEDTTEWLDAYEGVKEPVTEAQYCAVANMLASVAEGSVSEKDMVTLPNHYVRFKIEPIRFVVENGLNFHQANIIKYIMRYDAKNGLEDLHKAQRYLTMFIKWVEGDPEWWK